MQLSARVNAIAQLAPAQETILCYLYSLGLITVYCL